VGPVASSNNTSNDKLFIRSPVTGIDSDARDAPSGSENDHARCRKHRENLAEGFSE
jgi:hypothetical protein